jgi:hypothetical protein
MSPESTQKKFHGKWVDVRGRQGNVISEDHDLNQRLKSNHSRDGDTLPWVGDSWSPVRRETAAFFLLKWVSDFLTYILKLIII